MGYFATYIILSDTTVIHHVQGGIFPEYIGTDQRHAYQTRGVTLSISVDHRADLGHRAGSLQGPRGVPAVLSRPGHPL